MCWWNTTPKDVVALGHNDIVGVSSVVSISTIEVRVLALPTSSSPFNVSSSKASALHVSNVNVLGTPTGSCTGPCTDGRVGLVVDTSATVGPLCSSMLSCVDMGNDEGIVFGQVRLASLTTVPINIGLCKVCAIVVKGMVRSIIPRACWHFVDRLNKLVRGFVNGPFPRPCGILFIGLSTYEFAPFLSV